MCLPAEPPEMTAVGAPAGQTKQVGHQHTAFNASDCSSPADDALELWRLNWTLSACMVHL